jgi:hypothetical protein
MAHLDLTRSRELRSSRTAVGLLLCAALLAGVGACGGSDSVVASEADARIDTAALSDADAVAQAVASEHGAPGENEPRPIVLSGRDATTAMVSALRARGFENVRLDTW